MKHPKIEMIENTAYFMPVWYTCGHEVTLLSVARVGYHTRRLRLERREMLKRLAVLRALVERRWKDAENLLAENARLRAELVDAKATTERCFKTAMKNAVIINSLKLSLEAERRDNRLLRRQIAAAGLPSVE